MLPDPITRIDHRLARIARRRRRRPHLRVAQHNHIRVALQRAHRIRETLALSHRAVLHIVNRDHLPPQPQHRRHKAGTGARTRLIEQVGKYFSAQQIRAAESFYQHAHFMGYTKHKIKQPLVKLTHAQNVLTIQAIAAEIRRHLAHVLDWR